MQTGVESLNLILPESFHCITVKNTEQPVCEWRPHENEISHTDSSGEVLLFC